MQAQLNIEQAITTANQVNQLVEENQANIQSVNQTIKSVNSTINTVLEKKEELEKSFNMLQNTVSSKAATTLSSLGIDSSKYKLKSFSDMMNSIQNIIPPAVLYGSVMRKPMLTQFGGLMGADYETLEQLSMYAFFFLLPIALFVSFTTSQEKARIEDELAKSTSSQRRHQKVSLAMSGFRAVLCGLAYICYELFVGHVPSEIAILKSHLSMLVFVTFSLMAAYEWLDAKIDHFAVKYMSSISKKQE